MTDQDFVDIVQRLRDCTCVPHGEICREAADEIERLRHELDGARLAYRGASYDRDRMRSERDEARRMYCEAVILHGTAHRFDANGVPEEITEAEELARRLKWDCFKEGSDER